MEAVQREEDGALRTYAYGYHEPSEELFWLHEVRDWRRVRAEVEGRGVVTVFTDDTGAAREVRHGFILPDGLPQDVIAELALKEYLAEELIAVQMPPRPHGGRSGIQFEKHRPLSISEMRVFQLEPNLTVILPGKCQARCPFCIEPEGPAPRSTAHWLRSFEILLAELPPIFRTISISGGEPSLSPAFGDVLSILAEYRSVGRLRRVVLTTNGSVKSLTRHMPSMGAALTHANISRHAVEDPINAGVFKTRRVPTRSELAGLVRGFHEQKVPVNLNCVYSSDHAFGQLLSAIDIKSLRAEAERYIQFAREVGASSVVFRHDHRDPHLSSSTHLEMAFADVETVHEANCSSCHVITKAVHGMPVNFKRSAFEPVKLHYETELYEMVLHSDGDLYRDWSRQHPIKRPLPHALPAEDWNRFTAKRPELGDVGLVDCDDRQNTCQLLSVF